MGAPRKFDQETRERAVRMYHDRLNEYDGDALVAALKPPPLPPLTRTLQMDRWVQSICNAATLIGLAGPSRNCAFALWI